MKNPNLPDDRQFLITKGVPSIKRLAELKKFEFENEDEIEKDYKEVLKEKGEEPPKEEKILIGNAAKDPKFEAEFQRKMAEVEKNNREIEEARLEKAKIALE